MKKLVIVVPTANRHCAIDYWLQESAPEAKELGVDLVVYDSSDDAYTKEVTEKYISNGYKNVIYHRYQGYFDGVSLDHKLISIYEDYASYYEYIWIIRDGLIPRISSFYNRLMKYISEKYQCIIVDALYRNGYVSKEVIYNSTKAEYKKLLEEQVFRMQTLGMLIFSSDFAINLINEVPVDEKVYSLWQMAAPLHYFANHDMKIVFCIEDAFTYNPNCFKGHFWQAGEKLYQQWGVRWCKVIDSLPLDYQPVCEKVYKIYTCDFHPFKPTTVAELRVNGSLNFQMIKKYKTVLKKVTDTPIWFFYFASCTPKSMWKYILTKEDSLVSIVVWGVYMMINNIEPEEGRIEL